MSSFLLSDPSFCAIAQFGIELGCIQPEDGEEYARHLKFDNLHALHRRYGDPVPVLAQFDMTWTPVEAPMEPAIIGKLIRLYNYQCAEPPYPTTPSIGDHFISDVEIAYFEKFGESVHDLRTNRVTDLDTIYDAVRHPSNFSA